jgi:hypothetical protein
VVLRLSKGSSYPEISQRLGCTDRYTSIWKPRFKHERLAGLDSPHRGAEYRQWTAEIEA